MLARPVGLRKEPLQFALLVAAASTAAMGPRSRSRTRRRSWPIGTRGHGLLVGFSRRPHVVGFSRRLHGLIFRRLLLAWHGRLNRAVWTFPLFQRVKRCLLGLIHRQVELGERVESIKSVLCWLFPRPVDRPLIAVEALELGNDVLGKFRTRHGLRQGRHGG